VRRQGFVEKDRFQPPWWWKFLNISDGGGEVSRAVKCKRNWVVVCDVVARKSSVFFFFYFFLLDSTFPVAKVAFCPQVDSDVTI
jgi:hypothetical protein